MRPEPRERPIIFNAEMVRAVLDGRKTQTRRPLSRQPKNGWEHGTAGVGNRVALGTINSPHPKKGKFGAFIRREWTKGKFKHDVIVSPFGQPGDRLWVRETWAVKPHADMISPRNIPASEKVYFPATPELGLLNCTKYRPSIHMPRWASRILLEITDIRVERVQEITAEEAKKEGVRGLEKTLAGGTDDTDPDSGLEFAMSISPRFCFEMLWKSIYGSDAWDRNDWVWVVEFKRIDTEQQPKAVNS